MGPTSSIFDITTYTLMFFLIGPAVLRGSYWLLSPESQAHVVSLFQTGWFVESLWTQTLLVHMLRTEKIPFLQGVPGLPLFLATAMAVGIDSFIPFTPFGTYPGMMRLPGFYFPWLAVTLLGYLFLAHGVKTLFIRRYGSLV
ncbi:MAG: hypothetical protein QJR00_01565 [Bacillota bacterium]|nr:hypothetical protein [Bacillota bacterium]